MNYETLPYEIQDFPESGFIARAGYNAERAIMFLTFKNKDGSDGKTFYYEDFPTLRFRGLQAAESAGKYFHANIRGNYPSIEGEPPQQ